MKTLEQAYNRQAPQAIIPPCPDIFFSFQAPCPHDFSNNTFIIEEGRPFRSDWTVFSVKKDLTIV
jgi:hypothetical protein